MDGGELVVLCNGQAAQIMKQTYSELPVFDQIIPAVLKSGIQNLREVCHFTPGVPVGPMLAKATKSVSEILDKFQDIEFTCEYKYDGERAQVYECLSYVFSLIALVNMFFTHEWNVCFRSIMWRMVP